MRRSIRWRLQVWYAFVLLGVVASFAGILYYRVRAARIQEIDDSLVGAAQYLDACLRRFPPHELDGPHLAEPPPDGPGRDRPGRFPPGPLPWPPRERLFAELALPERYDPAIENARPAGAYFAVWRADGSLLKSRDLPAGAAPAALSAVPLEQRPQPMQREEYREIAVLGPRRTRIVVGRSMQHERAELRAFAWQLGGAGAAVLAVGLAGGWLIATRLLRPLAAISATASAISATNLAERIAPEKVDRELEELARVLNAMFERLEAAFERQARFTADASHELRTPLAIIRSHAELALNRPRTVAEYRETIEACLRASGRMTALVDGLLTLARADAGKLDLRREPVDLTEVVAESVALFRPLAEAKGLSLTADLAPALVTGDATRLAQVATNLLSNAIQYNRPGGAVRVQLGVTAGEVVFTVADTGCGIPSADCPHIFERFYRVEKARSRAAGGSGLGLAICKSIVESHGGTIGFETKPERGSTFWVRLREQSQEQWPCIESHGTPQIPGD